ncbi:hypothetical protein C8J56DRAFT_392555 [Mycena floridula]|nr:hypothetical protein C8J56DRAFT_392555 [Mycena floridula]
MDQVPEDVWRCIAEEIPIHQLMDLYEVNHFFFELAFNLRYGELKFSKLDKPTSNLLGRLDPEISRRARKLRVASEFLEEIFQRPLLLRQFSDLLGSLVDLKEYDIVWNTLDSETNGFSFPLYRPDSRSLAEILIKPLQVWHAGRSLKLQCSLDEFAPLLPSCLPLEYLEKAEIRFLTVADSQQFDFFAAFINTSHRSLRSLDISTFDRNYMPFFDKLGDFSSLASVSINMPILTAREEWKDPYGLGAFLDRHGEVIQSLTLKGNTPIYSDFDMLEHGGWIYRSFSKVTLPHLHSFTIDPTDLPLDTVLLCLKSFSPTLTSLEVSGRYMDFEDIESMLECMGPQLKRLTIGTITLSPQLVDLLAQRLPRLESLKLIMKHVVPDRHQQALPHFRPPGGLRRAFTSVYQDPAQIDAFVTEMRKRVYKDWTNVAVIEIWRPLGQSQHKRLDFQTRIAKVLRGCLSSKAKE